MRNVRQEGGRWPPTLWAHWERKAGFEKMLQNSLQMTPWETGVATHDTNSTARTLRWEPDTHLHCQRKGYFWKMGPSPWFNLLTNPRKRGLFPRQAVWFRDHTLVWIFSLSPHVHIDTHGHKHTQIISIFIPSWDNKATSGENCECVQYKADQTNQHCNGFHMPGVHYISMFPTRGITSYYERPELLFQAFNNTSARCCLLQVNYRAGTVCSFKEKNNKKSTFRTRGNKVSFWADTGHNGVCLSN